MKQLLDFALPVSAFSTTELDAAVQYNMRSVKSNME